jgi:hypothetical protein
VERKRRESKEKRRRSTREVTTEKTHHLQYTCPDMVPPNHTRGRSSRCSTRKKDLVRWDKRTLSYRT